MKIYNYLLTDKKGPYGITISHKKHAQRLIFRPDKIRMARCYEGAFFHTVPERFRPRTFEMLFIRYVTRTKRRNKGYTDNYKEKLQDSVRKWGVTKLDLAPNSYNFIYRSLNGMIKECLKYADVDALHTVYKFHFAYRPKLYEAICKYGVRVKQLLEVFPYLGYKIYCSSYGFNLEDQFDVKDQAHEMVMSGARLKDIVALCGMSMSLRKIKPQCLFLIGEHQGVDFAASHIAPYLSTNTWEQLRQLTALSLVAGDMPDSNFNKWILKHAYEFENITVLRNRMVDIGDWVRRCEIHNINPNMSLRRVWEETRDWHRNGPRVGWKPDVQEDFVVAPWFLEMEVDGYKFIPLVTKRDIVEEGEEMDHCVATYCNRVKNGESSIFSVRNGKRVATLELTRNFSGSKLAQGLRPKIGQLQLRQLRGPHNHSVSKSVEQTVNKWLSILKQEVMNG
jgi:hypothetical protein